MGWGIVDTFRRWDSQLSESPADSAPRIAAEIASQITDNIGMQQAAQQVNDYQARHRISPEERTIMQRVLASGEFDNLAAAHSYARYQTAADIKDSHERDVLAAVRASEGVPMFYARATVAEWEQRHPQARRNPVVWNKMQKLLESQRALTLDEAYSLAKAAR
jgi:hypothetical protein